jgi:hypothetical protein
VDLEVERVVLAEADVLVLRLYDAADLQLAGLGVEEGGLDFDGELCVDAVGGCAAGFGLEDDLSDGVGDDDVACGDEVVCVPLEGLG